MIEIGAKSNSWEVLDLYLLNKSKYKHWYYKCKCVCGTIKDIRKYDLEYNKSQSCGCQMVNHVKRTMLTVYGADNANKVPCIKEKISKTNLSRYGHPCSAMNLEVSKKIKDTCVRRYGADTPLGNKDIQKKSKDTLYKNHNVRHASHIPGHSEKAKRTSVERYGENYIAERIGKQKETLKKRYGVTSPMHYLEFVNKQLLSDKRVTSLHHWEDNSLVLCQGRLEEAVVEYLNINKIKYQWQSKIFLLKDGSTYRPDFYLEGKNLWVEIKGNWRKDAKIKWDLFTEDYINNELWDIDKLIELGITIPKPKKKYVKNIKK